MKTLKDYPDILSVADVMEILRIGRVSVYQFIESQDEKQEFMGDCWIDRGYVVSYFDGREPSISNFNKMMTRLLEQNGLRHIRFHDLRHSIATYLLEIGIPITDVSAWLGHSSVQTTAKVYAHVNFGMRMNTAKTLDKIFGYSNTAEEDKPLTIEAIIRELFES